MSRLEILAGAMAIAAAMFALVHGSDDHELKVLSAAMLVAFLVSEMDDEQRRAAMLSAVIKRLPSKVAEFLAGKAAIQ